MSLDVMLYEPGQDGVLTTIAGDQASMEAAVQAGTLAFVNVCPGLVIGYNSDGQSLDLAANRVGFYGPFFFTSYDGTSYSSLSEAHRGTIEGLIRSNASFV